MGDISSIRLLTTEELAAEVKVSRRTLEGWRRIGKGPQPIRVGSQVRYRIEDVRKWLDQHLVDVA